VLHRRTVETSVQHGRRPAWSIELLQWRDADDLGSLIYIVIALTPTDPNMWISTIVAVTAALGVFVD
jgi:hypothetical protein